MSERIIIDRISCSSTSDKAFAIHKSNQVYYAGRLQSMGRQMVNWMWEDGDSWSFTRYRRKRLYNILKNHEQVGIGMPTPGSLIFGPTVYYYSYRQLMFVVTTRSSIMKCRTEYYYNNIRIGRRQAYLSSGRYYLVCRNAYEYLLPIMLVDSLLYGDLSCDSTD